MKTHQVDVAEVQENHFFCHVSCFRQCSHDIWKRIRRAADSEPAQHTQPRQKRKQEHHLSTRNHRNYEEHSRCNNTDAGVQFSCYVLMPEFTAAALYNPTFRRELFLTLAKKHCFEVQKYSLFKSFWHAIMSVEE